MVNNSTNINKLNNHLSTGFIEHKTMTIDIGHPVSGLGQAQKMAGLNAS